MNIKNELHTPRYRPEVNPNEALIHAADLAEALIHAADLAEALMALQDELTSERKKRREERFVGIICLVIMLDVVFFSVMPTFAGPIVLLIFELLILIPLARIMGMKEIAKMLDGVLARVASRASDSD